MLGNDVISWIHDYLTSTVGWITAMPVSVLYIWSSSVFHFGSSVVLDYISDVKNINLSVSRSRACADDVIAQTNQSAI